MTHTLSKIAWHESTHIIDQIQSHPFNQELSNGTLNQETFCYYIEQDSFYLHEFARCHALVASQAPLEHIATFLNHSHASLVTEQSTVHQYYLSHFQYQRSNKMTNATFAYTNYLLRICHSESIEVSVAALLPCFWIYQAVGQHIANNTVHGNPYSRWIDTYSSDDFSMNVGNMITLFDEFGKEASTQIKIKMLHAFKQSALLEWHFWNDAYRKNNMAELSYFE